jgi:tetratricopeptide (TPR) repeat protein
MNGKPSAVSHQPSAVSRRPCASFHLPSPVFCLLLLLAACRSTPPPAPDPRAVTLARGTAAQAARAWEQGHWPAAARQWDLAAQRAQLVNDLPAAATARHNAGLAWQRAGDAAAAHARLTAAAELNAELGRTADRWRNEVALLQLGIDHADHCGVANRLARLRPLAAEIPEPRVLALFRQAEARAALAESRPAAARDALAAAFAALPPGSPDEAALLGTRARVHAALGDPAAAEADWRASLAGFERAGDPPGITSALAGLGRLLLAQPARAAEGRRLLERAAANYDALKLPAERDAARAALR